MTNYSLMSDLEINIEVAILQGFAREKCELGWSGKSDVGVEWSDKTGYPTRSFNFCNISRQNPRCKTGVAHDARIGRQRSQKHRKETPHRTPQ